METDLETIKTNRIDSIKYILHYFYDDEKITPYDILLFLVFVSGRPFEEIFLTDNFLIENEELYVNEIVLNFEFIKQKTKVNLTHCENKQFLEILNRFQEIIKDNNAESIINISNCLLKSTLEKTRYNYIKLKNLNSFVKTLYTDLLLLL